jgi:phospholipase/lecithinase/hemolysin
VRASASRPAFFAVLLAGCSTGGGDSISPPATPPAAGDSRVAPSALFVLGDSLSDVGNAAGAADYLLNLVIDPSTVGLCNPADVFIVPRRCDDLFYKQSRVSDGAVAVEHLAKQLGLGELEPSLHVVPSRSRTATVYAVASAKARGPGEEDLGRQVDWLLLDHAPLPADAVYVIMIGGNDAIDAMQADATATAAAPRPSAAIVTSAVAAIGSSVERLLDFGARRVVVANVPDLATLPAIREFANSRGDKLAVLAAASGISEAFDRELDAALDRIEARGRWAAPTPPDIERFDLRAALAGVQLTFAARGGNATDACFDSEAYRDSAAAERVFHPACAPPTVGAAPRFAEFVFWDGIHPTGAAHAAIGEAMRALL